MATNIGTVASLNTIPDELVSNIAASLILEDIRTLRLCSRGLARSSFHAFRLYLRRKNVILDPNFLQRMLGNLEHNGLACYMEEILFTDDLHQESPMVVHLLGRILVLANARDNLRSVDIETSHIGMAIVILALQTFRIPLRRLRFYPPESLRTLPLGDYHWDNIHTMNPCLETIKVFSWALIYDLPDIEYMPRLIGSPTNGCRNIDLINQVLSMARSTESLDLSWEVWPSTFRPGVSLFERCFESVLAMTRLQVCSLRNLHVAEAVLQDFLQRTTATTIMLKSVQLSNGGFRSIFDVITSGKFGRFFLEDLCQYNNDLTSEMYTSGFFPISKVIYKLKPGSQKHKISSSIHREGEAVNMHLEYFLGQD